MKINYSGIIKVILLIWFLALMGYNSIFTIAPDTVIRKVHVEKIEKGAFSTNIFNYFSPYDRKITVSDKHIGAIYAESDIEGFEKISVGDSAWVKLYCLESSSWGDFLLFRLNFNYELFSIPDQKDRNLTQDELIFTVDFWIHLAIVFLMFLGLIYALIKREKAKGKRQK